MSADAFAFFAAWTANPLRVASVLPSGNALAALITREISPCSGPVLELGPGTGVFTRALLARGVPEGDMTLVEYEPGFVRMLRERFPQARVRHLDAARVGSMPRHERSPFGAVVSGLPLLSMPSRKVMATLLGAFAGLRADGCLYQFTYGPRCPVSRRILDRLGLRAIRIGYTLRNLPPASVYRIARRPPVPLPIGSADVHG